MTIVLLLVFLCLILGKALTHAKAGNSIFNFNKVETYSIFCIHIRYFYESIDPAMINRLVAVTKILLLPSQLYHFPGFAYSYKVANAMQNV